MRIGGFMTQVHASIEPNGRFDWSRLETKWQRRTELAAQWLQNDRAVADVGCGLMALESLLAPGSTYIPMDIVARDDRTIVVDFNIDPIPAVICDVAVLLGVLEYSESIAAVLRQLQKFPKVVFSYNHVSLNDALWKVGLREKRVNWRNRHTYSDLRRMLHEQGFKVTRERRVRIGERLYEITSA